MNNFRTYSPSELDELARSEKPVMVHLILDEPTVDLLLGYRGESRPVNDEQVDALAESIEETVLQTIGTLHVDDEQLTDGQHRLFAVKQLGYPESLVATVVFSAGSK